MTSGFGEDLVQLDLVVRGGTVVDGTGAPGRRADVGVSGGRIVAVGDVPGPAAETIDAGGLVVCPGFIDSHTHMEAQLFWDPVAGPASWHGCTTVILGNCGLSLAPVDAGSRDYAIGLMSAVEQIPRAVLETSVPFDWTGIDGFASSLERAGTAVNAATFVGYAVVRFAVMGDRAFEGAASEHDLARIDRLLDDGLEAGALGISFNRAAYDHDEHGRLLPGYDAPWPEIARAAQAVARHPGTMLQVIPSWAELSAGWSDRNEAELAAWIQILRDTDATLVWSAVSEREWEPQLDATRRARAAGVDMVAAIHSVPIYTFATFATRGLFASTPGCDFLFDLDVPSRLAALRDDAVRARVREAMGAETFAAYPLKYVSETGEVSLGLERRFSWEQIFHVGAPPDRFELDRSIADVARAEGRHPVDVVLDLALASELRDVFVVFVHGNLPEVTERLLHDDDTVIASNDTGAHLMLMAQTQSTHLLDHWCRRTGTLSLERAVHLLTGRQSQVFGLHDRGTVEVGRAADLLVIDPAEIGPLAPEILHDLPGGAGSRYVTRSLGIRRVIVNGRTLLVDGHATGERPGRFVRA